MARKHYINTFLVALRKKARLPMSEREIVILLRKHGIEVCIGAQHSVRCQFGQLVEAFREVERDRYAGVQYRPVCSEPHHCCPHEAKNGECTIGSCDYQIKPNPAVEGRTAKGQQT